MANMFEKKKDQDLLERFGIKADQWKGFLEQEVALEGKLTLTGTFRCDAAFKGEIHCDGLLILGETARVEGDIRSKQVTVQGRVKGSIHAQEKLIILENAVVSGDIYTSCLVIEAGATFDGTCHMPTGESGSGTEGLHVPEEVREPVPVSSGE